MAKQYEVRRAVRTTVAVEYSDGKVERTTVVERPIDVQCEVSFTWERPAVENVAAGWQRGYRVMEPGPVVTMELNAAGAPSEDHL